MNGIPCLALFCVVCCDVLLFIMRFQSSMVLRSKTFERSTLISMHKMILEVKLHTYSAKLSKFCEGKYR